MRKWIVIAIAAALLFLGIRFDYIGVWKFASHTHPRVLVKMNVLSGHVYQWKGESRQWKKLE